MTTTSAAHIFLSYSRRNKEVMERVAAWLRGAGFEVWVDNEELTPGTPMWEAEIEGAIASAGAAVVLLSPDAKKSEWVRAEIEYAKKNGKRIFPVLVAGDVLSAVPLGLLSHQFADLRTVESEGLEELTEALRTYLTGSPGRQAPAQETAGGAPGGPDWAGADRRRSTPPNVPQAELAPAAQSPSRPQPAAAAPVAAQKRGSRNMLAWILGVVAVCVLGTCGVGAALTLPGLLAPDPATPAPYVTPAACA